MCSADNDTLRDLLLILVGAVIALGAESIKAFFHLRSLKKSLKNELEVNLQMLPHFRDFIHSALVGLELGGFPNVRPIRFIRTAYDSHYSLIAPSLKHNESISYQLIYDYLRICDETCDRFADVLYTCTDEQESKRQIKLYKSKLPYILKIADQLDGYIQRHLKGDPPNYFRITEDK